MNKIRTTIIMLFLGAINAPAASAEEFTGTLRPQTWLNWLSLIEIGGRRVFAGEAYLAFAWSLVAILLLTALSIYSTRRLSLVPGRWQIALEMIVNGIRSLVEGIIGPRGAEFTPFIGTLFIYIATMNLMGLAPGFTSPTANLNTTVSLALIVFLVVQYYGFRERGIHYFRHFVAGVPMQFPYFLLAPLVFVIHLMGELFRPVALALRLFGNMMAEEMVLLMLIGMVAGLARHWTPVPVQLPNMLLTLLTALVQALIFSMLATVYLQGVLKEEKSIK